jgi:hypothetical protein
MSNSTERGESVAALPVGFVEFTVPSAPAIDFETQFLVINSPQHHAAGSGFHVAARILETVV